METQGNDKKNSEDLIQSKGSPIKLEDSSEAEDSENKSTEEPEISESSRNAAKNNGHGKTEENRVESASRVGENSTVESRKQPSSKDNPTVKDVHTKKKEDSPQLETSAPTAKLVNNGNPKIANIKATSEPTETKETKRKRRTPSDQREDSSAGEEIEAKAKLAKVKNTNDNYCWRCHKDSVDASCSACPRSWHRKCMGGAPPTSINETWICGECATILRAENAETRSEVVAHLSIDHLCMLLKYIVERMRACQGSEPFWKAVDLKDVQNYMEYVVKPMDLSLLESNIRAKLYGSTDAFMADAKWIQHNCIVFNTCGGVYADTSKLTNAARQIIKTAKQEVAEIEACPDCYMRGRNLPRPHPMWFIEACRRPHPLIWAKLKGFPFWPAKAMPRVNGQGHVDVRFFGQHDRAWVPPKDLYLYSRDPPAPMPRKRRAEMAECIKEITRHCRKLELSFGPFEFAETKTPYNPQDPTQIKILLPQYDPLRPNDPSSASGNSAMPRKSPFRKRNVVLKRKIEPEANSTDEPPAKERALSKSETPTGSDSEKTVNTSTAEKTVTETVSVEASVPETPKSKKRPRKTLTNDDAKNITQDKTPNSTVKTTEAADTEEITIEEENEKLKVEEPENNEPETAPASKQIVKIPVQTTIKQKGAVVPLDKSLAALLRKVNPKVRLSGPRNSNAKTPIVAGTLTGITKIVSAEPKTSLIKVYKPKARMVDKVNAEQALKSTDEKDEDKTDAGKPPETKIINGNLTSAVIASPAGNTVSTVGNVSLLHGKRDNNIIITNSLLKMPMKKFQQRILVLNNGTVEPKSSPTSVEENKKSESLTPNRSKNDSQTSPQILATVTPKKQSRAKKSFPNKTPRLPQLLPKLPKAGVGNPLEPIVIIPPKSAENGVDYQLPPPEAGPVSARLHRGANSMAKRMAYLMEEAIKEVAVNSGGPRKTLESHQATIHSLSLQIERMQWQHRQQIAEIKHNTDRTLREMRASLEAERLRAIEEVRKEAEEEKKRCVDETKTKQWCSQCGREALFYCCWNTAYCDHLCQQAHWQSHQRKCAQKPLAGPNVSNSASDTSNKQQKGSNKGNPDVATVEVSAPRSSFLSPTVITKNLKIP